jgi:hypothetical protein
VRPNRPNHSSFCPDYDGSTAEEKAILLQFCGHCWTIGLCRFDIRFGCRPRRFGRRADCGRLAYRLAIDGYDPVAFFTDGKPVQGSADLELRKGGVIWRFTNVGNRAAFAAAPNVYMPQYGGYDPVGVARGLAVAGSPSVWMIQGQRLFLFYDNARRQKFANDPSRVTASADRKWPDVQRTLTP